MSSPSKLLDLPEYNYREGLACRECLKPVSRGRKDGRCNECLRDKNALPINWIRPPQKRKRDDDDYEEKEERPRRRNRDE